MKASDELIDAAEAYIKKQGYESLEQDDAIFAAFIAGHDYAAGKSGDQKQVDRFKGLSDDTIVEIVVPKALYESIKKQLEKKKVTKDKKKKEGVAKDKKDK
jgi:hypothetical protein